MKTHILGALLLGSLAANAPAAVVTIEPAASVLAVGGSLSVDVRVSGLGDGSDPTLTAFDLDIEFDDSLLAFEQAIFYGFLGDPALTEADIVADGLTSPGTLRLAESSFLDVSASNCTFCIAPYLEDLQIDSFLLASIEFGGLAPGIATIAFGTTRQLVDQDAGFLSVSTAAGAQVTVQALPVPPSVGLILLGLLAVLPMRRTGRKG
jgi:hypothetical protein